MNIPTTGAKVAPAIPSAKARRMTLASVVESGGKKAPRIVLLGTQGIGKTTFGAQAPAPIFICAEDGIPESLTIKRFPAPESWQDVIDALTALNTQPHEFRTLVVDTLDWLEPMLWRHVCERNNWRNKSGDLDIEAPGYGKGYIAATEEWRHFLALCNSLRDQGVTIILLAHAGQRMFENPNGANYVKHEIKLQKSAAAVVREWADAVLFASHDVVVDTEGNRKERGKGFYTGNRIVHTVEGGAYDAKNRYGLPPVIPFSWQEFERARHAASPVNVDEALSECDSLWSLLSGSGTMEPKDVEAGAGYLAKMKTARDALKIAQLLDRLRARVSLLPSSKKVEGTVPEATATGNPPEAS